MHLGTRQHHDDSYEYHAGDPEGHVERQGDPCTSDAENDLLSSRRFPAVDVMCDETHTDEDDEKASDPELTKHLLSH